MTVAGEVPKVRRSINALLWVCLAGLGVVVFIAITADWLAPHDPLKIDASIRLLPPSGDHLLGTDHLGRDVFSRLLVGTRTALVASLEAVSIALIVGVSLGLAIGYRGGWWDRLGTRFADVMQSIPALLLALAFIAVVGDGLVKAMLAVGLVFIDSYFRITRALVLAQREMLYVDAAHVSGLRTRTIFKNILPNISGPLIVHTSILLGVALLVEAMLSFLGVGAQPDQVSWGAMLEEARQNLYTQPSLAIFPGAAITLAVLLFNLTGEALWDMFAKDEPQWRSTRPISGVSVVPIESTDDAEANADSPVSESSDFAPERDLVLSVEGLTVAATSEVGEVELVSDAHLGIARGEVYGLVGESGSGKSITALAIMGLLPPNVRTIDGSVCLEDEELVGLDEEGLRKIRGERIAMIFQEAIPSLSPTHTIGDQLVDVVRAHFDVSKREAKERAAELLSLVGVPDAMRRLDDYPHQFSGGMAQRVAIAGALAGDPEILIADEPTTALDVTIQAQVLDLLLDLTDRLDMSVLLITHDIGVVANTCERVAVMYAGHVVEQGPIRSILKTPQHPYSEALLAAMPTEASDENRLRTIPGVVPPAWAWPSGCRFHPRCPYAKDECMTSPIAMFNDTRCIRAEELTLKGVG